ncbi:MAG TPA: SurA N-terminal domain-containing protein [Xanthobacteraceae bacterium]|nr:SurA N-terminal domain-containing protein [Xanthobacteraceae bacterium]
MIRTATLARALAIFGTTAACLAGNLAVPVHAQQVVARVNGEPITAVDVAQRIRLMQVSGIDKTPTQKEALDELVDERLKWQTARRYRIDISDAEVNRVVGTMAARMRSDPQQFAKALASAGISINTLKRKIRTDLAWNNIVRGKFQASLQLRERDIELAARARAGEETSSYTYTLHPILLVVPRGAAASAFEARRREAEGLRARFQNCEDGLRLARGLRDVAVRQPIIRSGGDLSAKQREVLEATKVGRLTPPDVTPSGIEVFALCDKKTGSGLGGAERDVREEMFGQRFQAKGKEYLQQLRRNAMIEIR